MHRLLSALVVVLCAVSSAAAAPRTFVSAGSGSDSNPCTRNLPCRSFAFAITVTDAAGEIDTLDPGGYGPVTINKALSIVSGLGEAGVLVPPGGNGISINAGASDRVHLRGLVIDGEGSGTAGIVFNSGESLTITNCVTRNLIVGISFIPNMTSLATLAVADTLSADNLDFGMDTTAIGTGAVEVVLDRVRFVNNGSDGFQADADVGLGAIRIAANDCVVSNNGRDGFNLGSVNLHPAVTALLSGCVIANNAGTAVDANGGGPVTVRFGRCAITGNTFSWASTVGTTVSSYGDNYINGNGDGDPSPSVIAKK